MTNNNETKTGEIRLEPNYGHLFKTMLREAQMQSGDIFGSVLRRSLQAEALRAVQRFLAPLNIAAQCMTNREAVEKFREVLGDIVTAIDKTAGEIEAEAAAPADEDDCTCADRSWYGSWHDTACPLAGHPRLIPGQGEIR